ncbi:carbohydrate-binding family 9-like protein [Galbibacter sp. EGI 63066]|uniref:carbohydrate-binding family 9-like protein n=1 Tax=Galbibacter sp. EGI 63066 TaxID=2993559 RepID=UPI002248E18B|nr:carbohydrate-binding family 9-like protein [Galbibacter sp. EGI 63066]MCX2681623.1 carbohydrate-binding family 9-like protein [Galbibacter sp. EGI 63066]
MDQNTLKILFTLVFFSGSLFVVSQNEQKVIFPKSYVAYKTSEVIKVDGKGDEVSWKNAEWTSRFIDIEGEKKPFYDTQVKMLWNDTYLYFYAEMEEPHVWATLKQRDTIIFHDKDFEIFIDPDGDTHNYIEFEMNALNTVWDLLIVKPYRDGGPFMNHWDIKGMKTAVHIDGTLNDPNDADKGWSVEVAMPWKALTETTKRKTPENDYWRINFSRVNWQHNLVNGEYQRKKDDQGNLLPEYNWVWSPQEVINMHEPERWGYVYFSTEKKEELFAIPKDEKIKWELYRLYRKQKQFRRKEGEWISTIDNLVSTPLLIDGQKIEPELEVHSQGWNINVLSPFSGNVLTVREDGRFINENSKE